MPRGRTALDAAQARYAAERTKRLRVDGNEQYSELAGTYLAACVIAATIYGAEALQAPKVYRPKNLSAGAAVMLRDVALSTCK